MGVALIIVTAIYSDNSEAINSAKAENAQELIEVKLECLDLLKSMEKDSAVDEAKIEKY